MNGIKGQCNEGGIRVPCFIRWPGKIVPGTKVQPIAAHIDLLPTLAAVCGAKHPQPSSLDGRSLLPLLTGQQQSNWSQRTLFEVGSVRTDRWRLMIEKQELFDMPNDPGQKTNVAAANPEVVRQLTEAYRAWDADMRRGLVGTPPPLPVGHKESPRTLLRTHLAQVNGAERNTPWPSGYINPWTRTDASVTWKLDVATAGRYAVRLNYVCAKKDLGAQLRIEAGGRSCTAIVDREADPTPMETYDRVPRTGKEANVLRWATLPVGSLLLDRGPVTLRVSVPQMPGQQAFAMSGVELELQPSTS
jgi:arylsulfatase A